MLRKQLLSLTTDDQDLEEYELSGLNRIKSMDLPSDWDDIRIAACYEDDYRNKT